MTPTATIKNAVRFPWGPVDNPVTLINGEIHGDLKGRFPDGHHITTSAVLSEDGDIITTKNSVYKVEWAKNDG